MNFLTAEHKPNVLLYTRIIYYTNAVLKYKALITNEIFF